jgi:hypothetical protein
LYELNLDTGAVIDSDVVDASLTGSVDGLAYLNGKVYVQKPTLDRILVWDPVSDTLVTTLVVATDLAGGLTGAADLGVIYATRPNGNIFAINPLTGVILATFTPFINTPTGLAYVHGELISSRSNTFGPAYRIDPLTGQVLGTFPSGGSGLSAALGGDGATNVPPGVYIVQLDPDESLQNVNFGNWIAGPAEIHGAKWNDLDQDGVWDQPDEPGLAGWTIFLDTNGNGVLNAGEASTVTGADGSYSFTGLAPGVYAVREVLQAGWAQTRSVPFVSLNVGERAMDVSFGNRALPGSISGYKWNDLDGDGVKEEGEPGLPDWLIYIDENESGTFEEGERATGTNSQGFYSLSQVPVGSHVVAELLKPGWEATYTPPPVVVGPGQSVTNVNFGNKALPASIRGQKWNDLDGDGVKEEGEPGLAGWTIFIDANENGQFDDGEQFTTTDPNGDYELNGLAPGAYVIAEVQQPGWVATTPKALDLGSLLNELEANHADITGLVPNLYLFTGGNTGDSIQDGGDNMYAPVGNFIYRNDVASLDYTNGTISQGSYFGLGSRYFTVKHPGLFALAAKDISIQDFGIAGFTGMEGVGTVNTDVLSTYVEGDQYTIFVKKAYGGTTPSINQLIVVPGDGAGIIQTVPSNPKLDDHEISNLESIDEVYYVFVSSANGGFISDANLLDIAEEFLANVSAATIRGTVSVTVGPGEVVTSLDFGNLAVPDPTGDYNRDQSVDAADYVFWRKFAGTPVATPYAGADGSGNLLIDTDDEDVWTTHFGSPSPTGDSPVAGAALAQAQESVAAFSGEPAVGNATSASAESSPDDAANVAASAEVHARSFEVFQPRGIRSRIVRDRESARADATAHNRLHEALRTWLSQARELDDSDGASAASDLCNLDSARDAYFDSFEPAFADSGAARRKASRHAAERLVALR